MTINQFIKKCVSQDNPLGDLAKDILRDKDFPKNKSENDIYEYLDFKTRNDSVVNNTFTEFWSEFQELKKK